MKLIFGNPSNLLFFNFYLKITSVTQRFKFAVGNTGNQEEKILVRVLYRLKLNVSYLMFCQ